MRLRRRGLLLGAVAVTGALALAACSPADRRAAAAGVRRHVLDGHRGPAVRAGPDQLLRPLLRSGRPGPVHRLVPVHHRRLRRLGAREQRAHQERHRRRRTTRRTRSRSTPATSSPTARRSRRKTFVDTFNFAANAGNGQQLGFVFGPSQLNVEGFDALQGKDSTDGKMSGLKAVNDTTLEVKLVKPDEPDPVHELHGRSADLPDAQRGVQGPEGVPEAADRQRSLQAGRTVEQHHRRHARQERGLPGHRRQGRHDRDPDLRRATTRCGPTCRATPST